MGLIVLIGCAWCIGGVWGCLFRADRMESVLLRMHLGLVSCALMVMIMGSFSLILVTPVLMLVALRSAIIRYRWLRRHPVPSVSKSADSPEVYSGLDYACFAAMVSVALLTLISALAPITHWDAGVAHLAVASDYARDGKIHLLTGNVYSAYPQALHSVFAYVFHLSGERGVALLCWGYGVLACATLWAIARRLADARAGILAAAFLATAPFFISQAGTVAIDLPFSALLLATVLCWVLWREEEKNIWLLLMGVLIGSACGVRHTAYIVAGLCALGIFWEGRSLRSLLLFCGVCLCAALPWLLRSYFLVGNPVFPLLDTLIPQDVFAYHQETRFGQHETVREFSVWGWISYPWSMVMDPSRYDGWSVNPGPWVWILGVPGLVMGGRSVRVLGLFSLLGMSGFYALQRLTRYAVPFYLPLLAVAGGAGSRLTKHSKALQALIVVSLLYGCGLALASTYFKVPVALGMESRESYLHRRVEGYATFAWINEHVPDGERVLTLDLRSYYIDRPTFQTVEQLHELRSLTADEKVAWMAQRNIRYIVIAETALAYPFIAHSGLLEEIRSWETLPEHFELISPGEGIEPVYKVLWPDVSTPQTQEQP